MSVDTAVSAPAVSAATVADLVGREVLMPGAASVARVERRILDRVELDTGVFVDGEMALKHLLPHVGDRVTIECALRGEGIWLGEWRAAGGNGVFVHLGCPQTGAVFVRRISEGAQLKRTGEMTGYEEMARLLVKAADQRKMWVDGLVTSAHEWADDNDLCVQFDEFMEEHGLPRRTRDYEVRVTVEALYLTVEATSEEEAEEMVTHEMILEKLEEQGRHWDFDVDA